jgi:hypothetical protein
MKLIARNIAVLLFIIFLFYSCVNVQNKKEIKYFQLKIILTDKIGQVPSAKLPQEIDSLFMPLEPVNCPKIAFLPQVEIYRYGLSTEYHRKINSEGSGWKVFFQKFYGNTSVKTLKSNITGALKKLTVGDSLFIGNAGKYNVNQTLEKIIQTYPSALYFFFNPLIEQRVLQTGYKDIPVYNRINLLLVQEAKDLCEKVKQKDQLIIIFFRPKLTFGEQLKINTIVINNKDSIKVNNSPKTEVPVPDVNKHADIVKIKLGKLRLPNWGEYTGDIINGKPDGTGTLIFDRSMELTRSDGSKVQVKPGESFKGVFSDGEMNHGNIFRTSGDSIWFIPGK